MIGRTMELEYLVRVYTDAVRAGTVKGFARKASARVQRLQEETLSVELRIAESVGAMDGREPTQKKNKRQRKCW